MTTSNHPPLSPAAQAVLDASMKHSGPAFEPVVRRLVAAALRTLADHRAGLIRDGEPLDHWWPEDRTRRELRNIADELDPPSS